MILNNFIDRMIKNLKEEKIMVIINDLNFDESVKLYYEYDKISLEDKFQKSLKFLSYLIDNQKGDDNKILIEHSPIYHLKKMKHIFANTKDWSFKERYDYLIHFFLVNVLSFYLINNSIKFEMAAKKEKIEPKKLISFFHKKFKEKILYLINKGEIKEIPYFINGVKHFSIGLEYFKEKQFTNVDLALNDLIYLNKYFNDREGENEYFKKQLEFFQEKQVSFFETNVLIIDLIAFLLITYNFNENDFVSLLEQN